MFHLLQIKLIFANTFLEMIEIRKIIYLLLTYDGYHFL
jgi:hypothetical protein